MRLAALLLALFAAPATIHAITIVTVPVGNLGNPAEMQGNLAIGRVDYSYDIGKYEVTNAQYVAFLNGVDASGANPLKLYNSQMTSDARGGINFSSGAASGSKYSVKAGRANNPVVFVNFFDAVRFTNWLHNGQGSANTEDGAYQLEGGTFIPANADFVARKTTASWCLPTIDEWYKAAYHKNDGITNHYWDYPTSSDNAPASDQPPGTGAPSPSNTANFLSNDGLANGYNDGYAVTGSPTLVDTTNYLTDVGAYTQAVSPYGTFDQGGNVWEWTETSVLETRTVAGGSWINAATNLSSANAASNHPSALTEAYTVGFRVARVVPQVIPGDYNSDGKVDAADYTVWRDTLGSHSDLRANGDNTGPSMNVIDAADYTVWRSNFGQPLGAAAVSATPVPETATSFLVGIAALLYSPRRKSPLAA